MGSRPTAGDGAGTHPRDHLAADGEWQQRPGERCGDTRHAHRGEREPSGGGECGRTTNGRGISLTAACRRSPPCRHPPPVTRALGSRSAADRAATGGRRPDGGAGPTNNERAADPVGGTRPERHAVRLPDERRSPAGRESFAPRGGPSSSGIRRRRSARRAFALAVRTRLYACSEQVSDLATSAGSGGVRRAQHDPGTTPGSCPERRVGDAPPWTTLVDSRDGCRPARVTFRSPYARRGRRRTRMRLRRRQAARCRARSGREGRCALAPAASDDAPD